MLLVVGESERNGAEKGWQLLNFMIYFLFLCKQFLYLRDALSYFFKLLLDGLNFLA